MYGCFFYSKNLLGEMQTHKNVVSHLVVMPVVSGELMVPEVRFRP
jgi:hypothetical protein